MPPIAENRFLNLASWPRQCSISSSAVAVVSGRIQGQTETATLRVEERYESFDLPGAYAIAIVLALIAIVTLLAMTLIKPREETA